MINAIQVTCTESIGDRVKQCENLKNKLKSVIILNTLTESFISRKFLCYPAQIKMQLFSYPSSSSN